MMFFVPALEWHEAVQHEAMQQVLDRGPAQEPQADEGERFGPKRLWAGAEQKAGQRGHGGP